jgi:hypothetical protein
MMVLFIVFLIQNPLILLIRSVYTTAQVAMGLALGGVAAGNLIAFYLFLAYMFKTNLRYQRGLDPTKLTNTNFPMDNPFYILHLGWIPT